MKLTTEIRLLESLTFFLYFFSFIAIPILNYILTGDVFYSIVIFIIMVMFINYKSDKIDKTNIRFRIYFRNNKKLFRSTFYLQGLLIILIAVVYRVPKFLISSNELGEFIGILLSIIIVRIFAKIIRFNLLKILLNLSRFILVVTSMFLAYSSNGSLSISHLERAVVASLVFDAIIDAIDFENIKNRLLRRKQKGEIMNLFNGKGLNFVHYASTVNEPNTQLSSKEDTSS